METETTYNDLVMVGHIRTDQKCPKCKGKFLDSGRELKCPKCLTTPSLYYIDLHYKGIRRKIRRDDNGQKLDSWARTDRLRSHICWEIDNFQFRFEKYQKNRNEPFFFEYYVKSWIKEQEIRHKGNEIAYSTLYQRRMICRKYLIPYFGRDDIRHIGSRGIKDFNLHLVNVKVKGGKGMSPKYREGVLGVLRNIFHDGLRSGDLSRMHIPVFPLKILKILEK